MSFATSFFRAGLAIAAKTGAAIRKNVLSRYLDYSRQKQTEEMIA